MWICSCWVQNSPHKYRIRKTENAATFRTKQITARKMNTSLWCMNYERLSKKKKSFLLLILWLWLLLLGHENNKHSFFFFQMWDFMFQFHIPLHSYTECFELTLKDLSHHCETVHVSVGVWEDTKKRTKKVVALKVWNNVLLLFPLTAFNNTHDTYTPKHNVLSTCSSVK